MGSQTTDTGALSAYDPRISSQYTPYFSPDTISRFLSSASPSQVSAQLTLSVNSGDTSSTTMPRLESYGSTRTTPALTIATPSLPILSPHVSDAPIGFFPLGTGESPLPHSTNPIDDQWNMGLMTMLQSHQAQQEQLKRIPILESQLATVSEDNVKLKRRIAALEALETEKQVAERDEEIERLEETNRNIKEDFKKYKEERLLVDLEKMKQSMREMESFNNFGMQLQNRVQLHREVVARNELRAERGETPVPVKTWKERKQEEKQMTRTQKQRESRKRMMEREEEGSSGSTSPDVPPKRRQRRGSLY